MKIIVCGAGRVGQSIVDYLAQGNNDIVVIDDRQKNLDDLAKQWDIQPILGSASHPNILEKAGAKDADMIIAVTDVDEVNMIACQIAHSVFHIPQKIARIDAEDFTQSRWANLYDDEIIPVDKVISPDNAIAEAIYLVLKVPGAREVFPLADKKIYILSFKCGAGCPLLKTPLVHLERLLPDAKISIVSVVRNSEYFIPKAEDFLEVGDDVYFIVDAAHADDALQDLKASASGNEKVVIFGGNQISKYLAQKIEKDDNFSSCKIIDDDFQNTRQLAKDLEETIIIRGDMMNDSILSEAGIDKADTAIAVSLKDKDNLLISLLSQKRGVSSSISLVNSRLYNRLVDNVGDSILVDRSTVTISSILQELRKSKIANAYSLGRGFGEAWELRMEKGNINIGKKISELKLPKNSKICGIYRQSELIFPESRERILEDDIIILFAGSTAIKKLEIIFS